MNSVVLEWLIVDFLDIEFRSDTYIYIYMYVYRYVCIYIYYNHNQTYVIQHVIPIS